jgi:putative glycerol-1-phosphate prenyltransferase
MTDTALHIIQSAKSEGRKMLAVLIDPDTPNPEELMDIVQHANVAKADLIFVGGSLLMKDALDSCIEEIKSKTDIPILLFPGSVMQISSKADAILFLSLISGRNPDLLIGNQVIAAPYVKQSGLEVLSTGYMLIDSGKPTTASYISGSLPIPYHKDEIASCTAMAGEMLGLKLIYMDGGSGADKHVSPSMIAKVRKSMDLPIIIGGGIRTKESAIDICNAGADVIVVGNASEKNPQILVEIANAIHQL